MVTYTARQKELKTYALDYFYRLIRIASTADENSDTCPSSPGQWEVAREAEGILQELGLVTRLDHHGYVFAYLPANVEGSTVKLGLIAHMDTAMDFNGTGIHPRIEVFEDHLPLDAEGQHVLSVADFPQMERLLGHELVVTDGSSLLSADDKAGMAAILSLARYLHDHPEQPHGELRFAFTPDEEIGRGAHRFNVPAFDADVAYTVDGGEAGELEAESFNAAAAEVCFHGRVVHPGTAKGKMVNAQWLAHEYMSLLDNKERPEYTEGREGFLHLTHSSGDVESFRQHWILRDFSREGLEARKKQMDRAVRWMKERYGNEAVEIQLRDQYFNMGEIVAEHPYLIAAAAAAYEAVGVTPKHVPIRGGTDGSQLSYMGLPCPNLFTGGGNFHGRFEYLSIPEYLQCIEMLIELVALFSTDKVKEMTLPST